MGRSILRVFMSHVALLRVSHRRAVSASTRQVDTRCPMFSTVIVVFVMVRRPAGLRALRHPRDVVCRVAGMPPFAPTSAGKRAEQRGRRFVLRWSLSGVLPSAKGSRPSLNIHPLSASHQRARSAHPRASRSPAPARSIRPSAAERKHSRNRRRLASAGPVTVQARRPRLSFRTLGVPAGSAVPLGRMLGMQRPGRRPRAPGPRPRSSRCHRPRTLAFS
jgi:hypothetical protein